MKYLQRSHLLKKILLGATLFTTCASYPVLSNGQTAEQAYEARMNKLYGNRGQKTEQDDAELSRLSKNRPRNMISREDPYLFYFKNKGLGFIEKCDENTKIFTSYLLEIKQVNLTQYDEFDRRKLIKTTKDEIRTAIAPMDYTTELTCPIQISGMEEYNFKGQYIRFHTSLNMAQMAAYSNFYLFGLNLAGTTDILDLDINEADAERVVKKLRGKDLTRNISAVYHFTLNPKLYSWKPGGREHVSATVTKVEFFHLEWRGGKAYFGEKFGEKTYETAPWVHPELN